MPSRHPLSHAQHALWFLHRVSPMVGAYHTGVALHVLSALDTAALERAVNLVARRHELLRSVFTESDGEPVRIQHEELTAPLVVRELPGAHDDALRAAVRAELLAPFALELRGAFRFRLLRRGPQDAVLLVAGHHIATDATSNWLVLRDLMHAYRVLVAGGEPEPGPPSGSHDTYVARESALLASPRGVRMEEYWREVCEGAVPAELPLDRARPAGHAGCNGRTHRIDLCADRVEPLRRTAHADGVSLFSYLLGTFQATLHRYTRQNTFLLGCPTTTRISPAVREVVGNLINTLVLRADFAPGTTLRDTALAADRQVKGGIARVGYPFELITRAANRPRTGAGSSLCRITFNMIGTATPDPLLRLLLDSADDRRSARFAGLLLHPYDLPQAEGQLDLAVSIRQSTDSLTVEFRYDADLFDEATVARLGGCFVRALDAAIADPGLLVARLRLVDGTEWAQLLGLGGGGSGHG
ncbi:condensation domain-containing protein [Streptomyces halstedii]|uniref:condensation domain-containing protein n=1 Tax=Streptomyces halstedii TaxID=1944 RepID=UPI003809685F